MGSYSHAHRAEKERWRPDVEAGLATCAELQCVMPTRHIAPDDAWDLAHDRRVCPGKDKHPCVSACYLGPAHATCNRREGGQEMHRQQRARRRTRL